MTASDLYAISQGYKNEGSEKCHWCGSCCTRQWKHDDPGPVPFQRGKPYRPSAFPASPWICKGCWAWKRKRITVKFLNGTFKDGQCPEDHSWWIEEGGAYGIQPSMYTHLRDKLLSPPLRFLLLLKIETPHNFLQLSQINDLQQIKAETTLSFSVDNVVHQYSVYELERVAKAEDANGMMPGTRALASLLKGLLPETNEEEKRGRGRPSTEENTASSTRRIVKEK
mgnify:FL=1